MFEIAFYATFIFTVIMVKALFVRAAKKIAGH